MENTKYLIVVGVPAAASFGSHPGKLLDQPPTTQRMCHWPGVGRKRPSSLGRSASNLRPRHRNLLTPSDGRTAGPTKADEFIVARVCPSDDQRVVPTIAR
jgi:hypothetical protein